VIYATDVPVALQSIQEGSIEKLGLKKAIIKTASQSLIYPVVLLWMSVKTRRHARPARTTAN
jgi:hypothetical protein